MKIKRCMMGILSAFFLLIFIAAYLDEPGLFFVSGSVGIFILVRYWIFFSRIRSISSSFDLVRIIDKTIIRQGHRIKVIVKLNLCGIEGIQIQYTEKETHGCSIEKGEQKFQLSGNGLQSATLAYWLIPITHGNLQFAGSELTFSDSFFIFSLLFSTTKYTGPVIKILPNPRFVKFETKHSFFGKESSKSYLSQGACIRMYREYIHGDDFSRIDWKLSAKYDKLHVREYTGYVDDPPLIIVDLPAMNQMYNQNRFERMVGTITGNIDKILKKGYGISMLVISGPNIIEFHIKEHDWNLLMDMIRGLFHPQIQLHHLYHLKQRSVIREDLKRIMTSRECDGTDVTEQYYKKISQLYHKVLLDSEISQFSSHITRILDSIRIHDIFLYSLCDGDLSHIKEIALQAHYIKTRFSVKTPSFEDINQIMAVKRTLKGEIIEDIL